MATTHTLVADTRMEDLPGLDSGDTIAIGGHVLTCESNLSAFTGLYATGTGTIRLLDGANCDFSGSNPLPDTVTIEGGTEDNPLPAHGEYGYGGRAAAVVTLRSNADFSGKIVSHCVGNMHREQYAIVVGSTANSVTLDRPVDWEAGDAIGWTTGPINTSRPVLYLLSRDASGCVLGHAGNVEVPIGAMCILLTAGMLVCTRSLLGAVVGDEIGVSLSSPTIACFYYANIELGRLVLMPTSATSATIHMLLGGGAHGRIGCACTMGNLAGRWSNGDDLWNSSMIGPISVGHAFASGVGNLQNQNARKRGRATLQVLGGRLLTECDVIGHAEYVDTDLPGTLYSALDSSSELIIRTTTPPNPTHIVHRASGIATRVDRTDIEVPTSLPDAWRLDPIEDGTAWHDVPMTVLPGKTLSCIWYWMLGEEGATAGCQILDGEGPGWGSIAMNPGMAEVLAETTVPDGASPLRPFVAVPISWRNPGREIRKVVLRGWARGGTAYSRIDPAAGGLA